MTGQQRVAASPGTNPETKAFWAAADEARLLIGLCRRCDKAFFYPRALCPFCLNADTGLRSVSGDGTIYSYSVVRFAPVPYAIALVTLAEGPTMMTNIVDCDLDRLSIGQRVRVTFKPSEEGQLVPMFAPAT
jgi:uncharacterized protein